MGAINQAVFSLQSRSSGQWYAEVVPTANVAAALLASTSIGVTYQADPTAFFLPSDEGVGAAPSGATTFNGAVLTPMAGYASGNTVMIAFDADTGEVWFGVNGTFTGNPAAGTGAANTGFLLPAGTFKIFVGCSPAVFNPGEGFTSVLRARAAQQTYTAPSGFLPWEDA